VSGEAPDAPLVGWPRRPGAVLDWLVGEARHLRDTARLLGELCDRLVADGLPIARVTVHIRTLHPEMLGERFVWRRPPDLEEASVTSERIGHGMLSSDTYLRSPVRVLFEGAGGFRRRLDIAESAGDFPLLEELRREGLTDYVALPIRFGDARLHAFTVATDRPGGFGTEELLRIADLLPVLGLVLEIQALRRIGTYLLDTYVGHHAGARILSGEIRRGTGETIRAAIWYADLQGFTEMSERLGRDELIACLNEWFEALAGPIEAGGGEILKLIGDAMLAIFRLESRDACSRALAAAAGARRAVRALNARRLARGDEALAYGIGLHVGDVMYGNIGAAHRLDFTVIGPAVNVATRIEELCRAVGTDILVSSDLAAACGCPLPSLGRHRLRGSRLEIEVFALPERMP
jgi:adenylate cyclase